VPTHSQVARLNLEYYRKQAKALLKAAKTQDQTRCDASISIHRNSGHLRPCMMRS